MARVIPFKGIVYNPEKVDASATMAPPYDIVSHDLKDELYRKSPHNIIRIDFGKDRDGDSEDENRYTRAARYLTEWLSQDILSADREPSFYCYEIRYALDGVRKSTRGFLAAVGIEELGKGSVHPHEMTYSKPKSDRLNILKYCGANTSPIYSMYSSEEKLASTILEDIAATTPFIQTADGDGFQHCLWRISDKASIETIKKEMADRDIFIADGHHRYETALAFKKEMEEQGGGGKGDEPFNYVLMFLANMEEDGMTLLPTHRIVEIDSDIYIQETLGKYFTIEHIKSEGMSETEVRQRMFRNMQEKPHTFGMFLTNADAYYSLSFNNSNMETGLPDCLRSLDVTVLHKLIFEELLKIEHYEYEMDPDTAVERAKKGSFEAVFFLNPTNIRDVKEVALAGHRMPPKSTYFYPKLLTGMVLYKF